jgi:hypothetical protein
MGSRKYGNENAGEFFDRFFGCRRRTALHLAGYNDCHYCSFSSGLAKVNQQTATHFVKDLPGGRTCVYVCENDWD